ncbi:uncharacterized protein LOC113338706 [Papaver somniferum]|uniref:uncharacterized protein LOC113338706 n=1 Tax=Papaver somniferum TaxID=3469 RepID=UPI000E6F98ED|nr:uncharacterized protein LOC113338706 [Papaver somniferum]
MGSGNWRRIQFVECPDNMNGMIDAATYADAVMLFIDAKYGFEMLLNFPLHITQMLPLKGFALVNVGFAIIFPDKCNDVEKKIIFDDLNTERLRIAVRGNAGEAETF